MAAYTMPLKAIIERYSQDEPFLSHSERIERGRKYLFDFEYPLFNKEYRKDFETHFIRNFYTREIGSETEGLFKFRLETWLQINMPYYNKLFESELLSYDPLIDTDWETTENKKTDSSMTGTGETNAESEQTANANSERVTDDFTRNIFSDTPDSRLNLTTNDGEGVLEYATNISEENQNNKETAKSDNSNHSEGTQTSNVTEDRTQDETASRKTKGKTGGYTYAEMIMQHRQTFIRIEKQMFEEMERLFMLVY